MPRIKKQHLKVGDIVYTGERRWSHCLPLFEPLIIISIEPPNPANYDYIEARVVVCEEMAVPNFRHSLPYSTLRRWKHETNIPCTENSS